MDTLSWARDTTLPRALARARAGSRRAFAQVWQELEPVVHGVLLAVVDRQDVDDVMQDVAVAVMESLPSLHRPDCLRAWVCAIARNRGRKHLARRRERTGVELDDVAQPQPRPGLDQIGADDVLRAIRTLPECYRVPLTLRLVTGMAGPDIARTVGLTDGSLRVNLCRGMKLLRRALGTEENGAGG